MDGVKQHQHEMMLEQKLRNVPTNNFLDVMNGVASLPTIRSWGNQEARFTARFLGMIDFLIVRLLVGKTM